MARRPNRVWLVGLALIGVWVVAYWLTPARRTAPPEPSDVKVSFQAPPPEVDGGEGGRQEAEDAPVVVEPGGGDGEPAPTIPPSYRRHTVVKGDTLTSISERYFGSAGFVDAIARMNGSSLDPMRTLREGQQIKVPEDPRNVQGIPADPGQQPAEPDPGFTEYIVARGDTLTDISMAVYGRASLWTRIRDANPKINRDGTNIRAGWKLIIPPPP